MIERVEFKPNTAELQSIQSTAGLSIAGKDDAVSSHNEVLVHSASLLGELHWTGTMNAFRVTTAFQAQQQLLSTRDSDQKVELTTQTLTGIPQASDQSIQSTSVRPVIELDEEQNNTATLRGETSPENRYRVVENAEHVLPFAAVDSVANTPSPPRQGSKPKLTKRQETVQFLENGRKRLIFRGRLIRVGNTSQFVERLTE